MIYKITAIIVFNLAVGLTTTYTHGTPYTDDQYERAFQYIAQRHAQKSPWHLEYYSTKHAVYLAKYDEAQQYMWWKAWHQANQFTPAMPFTPTADGHVEALHYPHACIVMTPYEMAAKGLYFTQHYPNIHILLIVGPMDTYLYPDRYLHVSDLHPTLQSVKHLHILDISDKIPGIADYFLPINSRIESLELQMAGCKDITHFTIPRYLKRISLTSENESVNALLSRQFHQMLQQSPHLAHHHMKRYQSHTIPSNFMTLYRAMQKTT